MDAEQKQNINFDDWDQLPLAPDDDWDNIPLPKTVLVTNELIRETQEASPRLQNTPKESKKNEEKLPVPENITQGQKTALKGKSLEDEDISNLLKEDEDGLNDDFDNLIDVPTDGLDDIDMGNLTLLPESQNEDEIQLESEAKKNLGDAAEQENNAPPVLENMDLNKPQETQEASLPPTSSPSDRYELSPDKNEAASDFDSHLNDEIKEGMAAEERKNEASEAQPNEEKNKGDLTTADAGDDLNSEIQDIVTQKVELDIDGIIFDENTETQEQEKEEKENEDEEEIEETQEEPAQEAVKQLTVEEKTPRLGRVEAILSHLKGLPLFLKQVPKKKLILLIAGALAVIFLLFFAVYSLFSGGKAEESVEILSIDPTVVALKPEAGSLPLGPFYIAFPTDVGGEIIIEMRLSLYYKDIPDKKFLENKMPIVRDIIYKSTSDKGSQIVSDGDAQRVLRQELKSSLNQLAADKAEPIDYVQILEIKILR